MGTFLPFVRPLLLYLDDVFLLVASEVKILMGITLLEIFYRSFVSVAHFVSLGAVLDLAT
jgi:hypothetical protein